MNNTAGSAFIEGCSNCDIFFVRTHTTILDVTVGFDQPSYSISEGAGLLNVCAILTGVADREVLVTLTTMEISAEGIATCYF